MLALALLMAAALWFHHRRWPASLYADHDLDFVYTPVAEPDNMYFPLAELPAAIRLTRTDIDRLSRSLRNRAPLDAAWAQRTLDANARSLQLIHKAAQKPEFEQPGLAEAVRQGRDAPLMELTAVLHAVGLKTMQGRLDWRAGRHVQAIAAWSEALKVGEVLQQSNNPMVYYAVALAVTHTVLEGIASAITSDAASPEAVKALRAWLARVQIRTLGFRYACIQEYQYVKRRVVREDTPDRDAQLTLVAAAMRRWVREAEVPSGSLPVAISRTKSAGAIAPWLQPPTALQRIQANRQLLDRVRAPANQTKR